MRVTPERTVNAVVAAMVAAVAAATAVGFWLSYGGLHDFAVTAGGLTGPEAWAWPASVDLFIVAGEAGVTISALRHDADWMAWCYLALGFAASVTGNVLHVHPGELSWAKYAVAAVPPVAAMLALAALLRHVYRLALDAHLSAAADADQPVTERPEANLDKEGSEEDSRRHDVRVEPVTTLPVDDRLAGLAGLTRGQQAEALGMPQRTLYRKIKRGELPELAGAGSGNGKAH